MNPPKSLSERWVFASGRQHGNAMLQALDMAKRISEYGLEYVTIEVVSEETYELREKVKKLEKQLQELSL